VVAGGGFEPPTSGL